MTQVKHTSGRSEINNLGEGRIAFPFVHKKRTKSAGGEPLDKPRNDLIFLLPKMHADPAQCGNYKQLAAMIYEAAQKGWPTNVDPNNGQWVWPAGAKWPVQDGDQPHRPKPKPGVAALTEEQIQAKNSWRKGHWVIECAYNFAEGSPKVCKVQNGAVVDIPAQEFNGVQLYKSGDYGFVRTNAYTFQNKTFGVNFGLEGVAFTRPGELIGSSGQRSAQEMFGGLAGTAAPLAPQAPTALAPPPGLSAPPAPPAPPMPPQPPGVLPPMPAPR